MSFLQKRPEAPVAIKYQRLAGNSNEMFPPNKNPYYFVALFGGNQVGLATDNDSLIEMSKPPVPNTHVSFWVHEGNEGKGQYLEWMYTGKGDPIEELGLNLPAKQQSKDRYMEIWKGKNKFQTQFPRNEWFLPVLTLEKKGKDYEAGEFLVLVVSDAIMRQFVQSANSDNILDSGSPDVFGRIFSIMKDPSKTATEMYSVEVLIRTFELDNEQSNRADELHSHAMDTIEQKVNTTTGGDFNPDSVREYITVQTSLPWEEFVSRYNVFTNVELVESEQTDF